MGSGQGEREEGTPEGRKTVVRDAGRSSGGSWKGCRSARNTECEGGGGRSFDRPPTATPILLLL